MIQSVINYTCAKHNLGQRYVAFQPDRGDCTAARGRDESVVFATGSFAADCGRDNPLLTEASLLSWMCDAGVSACVTRLRNFREVFTQARSWAGR